MINRLVLITGVLIFLGVNTITLHDGHNWGDDFAQYIHNAQNLIEGRPYATPLMLEESVTVAPGFPLLIMPILKLFGLDFPLLKFLNILCWLMTAGGLYVIARGSLDKKQAGLVFFAFLSSPAFFTFKQNVLADIPFACFITTALAVWEIREACPPQARRKKILLLIAALFFTGYAFLIKPAGALLFSSLLIFFFVKKKSPRLGAGVIIWFFLLFSFQKILGVTTTQHYERIDLSWLGWIRSVVLNIPTLMVFIYKFFMPFVPALWPKLDTLCFFAFGIASFVLLPCLIIALFKKAKRKTLRLWETFLFVYVLALILWPIPNGRYVYPILGLFLLAVIEAFLSLAYRSKIPINGKTCVAVGLAALIGLNMIYTARIFNFNDDVINQPPTRALIHWMKTETSPHERFMFRHPRALGLLTGRRGTPLWMHPGDLPFTAERIEKFRIDYVIISRDQAGPLMNQLAASGLRIVPAGQNPGYKILKIIRP